MVTKGQIDQFFVDLDRLGLLRPNAGIAKATGFPKSNVSDYLRRVKPPSENFLKKFYEVFGSSLNVPQETTVSEVTTEYLPRNKSWENIAESNRNLSEAQLIWARNYERLTSLLETSLGVSGAISVPGDQKAESRKDVEELPLGNKTAHQSGSAGKDRQKGIASDKGKQNKGA